MKKLLFLLLCFTVAATFYTCNITSKNNPDAIPATEVKSILQQGSVQLIDIRTPKEFKTGYIENAQNIDFSSSTFLEDVKKLDKNKPVILYCRSGRRSALAYRKLRDSGFTEIYDLDGGIIKWLAEDLKKNQPF